MRDKLCADSGAELGGAELGGAELGGVEIRRVHSSESAPEVRPESPRPSIRSVRVKFDVSMLFSASTSEISGEPLECGIADPTSVGLARGKHGSGAWSASVAHEECGACLSMCSAGLSTRPP